MRIRYLVAAIVVLLFLFIAVRPSSSDSSVDNSDFVYARIRYHMVPEAAYMREAPWHHDYPYGDETFPSVLAEVSSVQTGRLSHQIVDIDSPDLFKYPFTYL